MKRNKKPENATAPAAREALSINLRALRLLIERFPQLVAALCLHAVVDALAPYVTIYLSARLLDELAGARDAHALTALALAALCSTAALWALRAALERWGNARRAAFYPQDQELYAQKLMDMDYTVMEDPHTHDLHAQIMQVRNWSGWGMYRVSGSLPKLLGAFFRIAGALALSVSLFLLRVPESGGALRAANHPAFTALMLLLTLFAALLAPALSGRANGYWVRAADEARFGNRLFGFLGWTSTEANRALDMRMYRQDLLIEKLQHKYPVFTPGSPIARAAKGPMGALNALSAGVSASFLGVAYAFVCVKALGGAFSVGAVTQYVSALTALSAGITQLVAELSEMRNNAAFLRTSFEFLDLPNPMYQGSLTVEKRADREYEVEFRDVSFRYPGREDWALRRVSIKLRVGERLAVVGRNGSGKTTFIKLLCRLMDPTEGEILLNGIDIRKYDAREYLSLFSVVFQDFRLLAFPLHQNVAASAEPDLARAEECLRQAGFGERLDGLPKGLDTCLYREFERDGVDVSGGEAQKIALSRALYKDAPFIVLDEPTAALDPVAEFEVYSHFDQLVGDKTAVYISHRLASCRFCDRIAVFEQGQIVQTGAHEALLAEQGGQYQALWQAQARYYAKGEPA